MTAIVNFNTASNADFVVGFTLLTGGVPLDLTGSTLRMMVRAHPPDAEVYIAISSNPDDFGLDDCGCPMSGGLTITDALNGKVTMVLSVDDLKRMPAGEYAHDLVRERSDGILERDWEGAITHEIGVTR